MNNRRRGYERVEAGKRRRRRIDRREEGRRRRLSSRAIAAYSSDTIMPHAIQLLQLTLFTWAHCPHLSEGRLGWSAGETERSGAERAWGRVNISSSEDASNSKHYRRRQSTRTVGIGRRRPAIEVDAQRQHAGDGQRQVGWDADGRRVPLRQRSVMLADASTPSCASKPNHTN